MESVGPRCVGVGAACLWGSGFIVGAAGIYFHQLWLLYLGYGVLGGCGLGLGYVSPVATLIRWFPYRRGMATGMAIMGFGGGAVIAAPLKEFLLKTFYEAPQYLGSVNAVPLITDQGRRFAQVGGQMVEVVVVEGWRRRKHDRPRTWRGLRSRHWRHRGGRNLPHPGHHLFSHHARFLILVSCSRRGMGTAKAEGGERSEGTSGQFTYPGDRQG